MTEAELAHAALYYTDYDAWRAAENARLIASGEVRANADDEQADAIAELIEDVPSGGNHGRTATNRRPTTSPDQDGEKWGAARRSLDTETHANVQFVAMGGASVVSEDWIHFAGGVTDRRPEDGGHPLTQVERRSLDTEQTRAAALERLGFSQADLDRLSGPGTGNSRDVGALRARFDAALLQVSEDGGRTTDLARALGWHVTGAGRCDRMTKALTRARKRRAAGHPLPLPPDPAVWDPPTEANPTGLCECGCGGSTPLATRNRPTSGQVKGRPVRFLPGHAPQARSKSP